MPSIAVIGTQWGDEGKAKMVDLLAKNADAVVRTSGGNKAGHSVAINGMEYRFSSIPCGIIYPNVLGILGNGTAINPEELLQELDQLKAQGLSVDQVKISIRAHLVMPYHIILDGLMDEARENEDDGDPAGARRGIRPCYMDKLERIGIRVCDLLQPKVFAQKVRANVALKNRMITRVYGGVQQVDAEETMEKYLRYGEQLKPYIADTGYLLDQMLQEGKRVIFEGAQATMLDPDYGTYPYVTSSHPTIGGVAGGCGVGMNKITHTLGVMKAYTTRNGRGPFPTEIFGRGGYDLKDRGDEVEPNGSYRRIGWFDAVAARYAVRVNGLEGLALTKMNAMRDLKEVKICVAYKHGDEIIRVFPSCAEVLAECEPVYETLPGWGQLEGCNSYEELPREAKAYVDRIEELTGAPVMVLEMGMGRNKIVSWGPVNQWLQDKEASEC